MSAREAVVHFDGGCRPTNPGHAGFAVVVNMDGNEYVLSRYIGKATNNHAEYVGLVVAIKYAKRCGATSAQFISDSKLVVNQVNGEWKVRNDKMRPFVSDAKALLEKNFPDAWKLTWTRRENNTVADRYCGLAIEAGRNRNPWHHPRKPGKILDPVLQDYES